METIGEGVRAPVASWWMGSSTSAIRGGTRRDQKLGKERKFEMYVGRLDDGTRRKVQKRDARLGAGRVQ